MTESEPVIADYPNTPDGDALRRVAAMGGDMTRPMAIDFFVVVPSREAGEAVAPLAAHAGFLAEVAQGEDDAWECTCTRTMLPTYENVVGAQHLLDGLAGPFGGRSDGWGTFGEACEA